MRVKIPTFLMSLLLPVDLTQKLHVQNMITLPKIFSPNLECQDDLKTLLKFPNFFDHGLLSQF